MKKPQMDKPLNPEPLTFTFSNKIVKQSSDSSNIRGNGRCKFKGNDDGKPLSIRCLSNLIISSTWPVEIEAETNTSAVSVSLVTFRQELPIFERSR